MKKAVLTLILISLVTISGCGDTNDVVDNVANTSDFKSADKIIDKPVDKILLDESVRSAEDMISNIQIQAKKIDDKNISIIFSNEDEHQLQGITLHVVGFESDEGVDLRAGLLTESWLGTQNFVKDKKEFIIAMMSLDPVMTMGEIAKIELSDSLYMPETLTIWAEIVDDSKDYNIEKNEISLSN